MKPFAFEDVDALMITIEQLGDHKSLDPYSQKYLKHVYKHLESLEDTAKATLQTRLDSEMSRHVRKLRSIVHEIKKKSESNDPDLVEFSIKELEKLTEQSVEFNHRLKKELVPKYGDAIYNTFPQQGEGVDRNAVSSKVIGVQDVYEELKQKLMSSKGVVISLVGMPGVGKTTLANKVFNDPNIVERFHHRVWVRVGKRGPGARDIARCILAEMGVHKGDEDAALKARLERKRYLIVLDDVWDRFILYFLHPYYRYESHELKHPFLHSESGSQILLTSRLQQLDPYMFKMGMEVVVNMRLMKEEESWDLLCDSIFGEGSKCPPQLVKVGKKIAKKCEGLPLTILTVAPLLKDRITLEYWDEVVSKKTHQIFKDAYDEMAKVLLPSYTYLPRLLQMCFLYVGLFPQNYEIPRIKLINLWLADKFLELNVNINSDSDALSYLGEMILNSVVMVYKNSTFNAMHTVKTCGLHSSFWHLSKQKAMETKFALILTSPDDCCSGGHQRLSIHTNVLLGMKDVHKYVEDNCASTARSLLCFGLYHQYQVPLCFRLSLLKELHALTIRFYDFPMEVLQLVRLTYLSLTMNGTIPASISQLQLLEFLIVDRHQSIKFFEDASYLPVEIWSLKVLKHLQVMGSDLPDPCGASLDNLLTLSNVGVRSCTAAVLQGVPNLEMLKVHIELAPDGDAKPLSYFDHIYQLTNLSKLKVVIVNPEVVRPIAPFRKFPGDLLFNLSLSGLGFSWKEMREIALLPYLIVLKLKNYAFQDPEWKVDGTGFPCLGSLIIEDINMVDWKLGYGAFPLLQSLIIRSCYKLDKIHGKFGEPLKKIELVDCKPSFVEEMKKAIPNGAKLQVYSSWDDDKKRNK